MSGGSFGSPAAARLRSPQIWTAAYAPTASTMSTQAALLPTKSLAKPMTKSSCSTTVPRLPISSSTTPFQPSRPASVTTNDGMPTFVMITPCSVPMTTPEPSAAAIATAVGTCEPSGSSSSAVSTPATPLT